MTFLGFVSFAIVSSAGSVTKPASRKLLISHSLLLSLSLLSINQWALCLFPEIEQLTEKLGEKEAREPDE